MNSEVIEGPIRLLFLYGKVFFLSSTLIYQPTLITVSSNTNIMKIKFFLKMRYDLRAHRITFNLWRGCVAFVFSDFLILWQTWLTFLWITSDLFLKIKELWLSIFLLIMMLMVAFGIKSTLEDHKYKKYKNCTGPLKRRISFFMHLYNDVQSLYIIIRFWNCDSLIYIYGISLLKKNAFFLLYKFCIIIMSFIL